MKVSQISIYFFQAPLKKRPFLFRLFYSVCLGFVSVVNLKNVRCSFSRQCHALVLFAFQVDRKPCTRSSPSARWASPAKMCAASTCISLAFDLHSLRTGASVYRCWPRELSILINLAARTGLEGPSAVLPCAFCTTPGTSVGCGTGHSEEVVGNFTKCRRAWQMIMRLPKWRYKWLFSRLYRSLHTILWSGLQIA